MDKSGHDGRVTAPSEDLPDVASALNRVMLTVKGIEMRNGRRFNNVALATEVSALLGMEITHGHIAKIRQGVSTTPRGHLLWAIGRALSTRTPVEITPDYFFIPTTRARVDRELDLGLEQLVSEQQRAGQLRRGASPPA